MGAVLYPEGTSTRPDHRRGRGGRRRPRLVAPLPRGPQPRGRGRRCGTSTSRSTPPDEPREPGRWFFHELEGLAVRSTTGEPLGTVVEIYRAGGAEVFVVRGPRGELDVPGVTGIVTELAPERGEMIVDLDALDLDARPVEDDEYVRPRDRRPQQAVEGSQGPGPAAQGHRPGPQAAGRRPAGLMPLEVDVLTLFPPMVEGPLGESIPARIQERGLATVRVHDLRRWGLGRHQTVDDYTYGGGAGMVLRADVVAAALAEVRRPDSTVILLDPAGRVFRQAVAHELAERPHLVFLCPRYEGVDERVRSMVDLELSIGDYVLTGGELAALVVLDAVLRLLPGAIDEASTAEESFAAGLLEYPQYTRPAEFEGAGVPPIARLRAPRAGAAVAPPRVAAPDARPAPGPARGPAAHEGGGQAARGGPRRGNDRGGVSLRPWAVTRAREESSSDRRTHGRDARGDRMQRWA